jgi:hypothetical protein
MDTLSSQERLLDLDLRLIAALERLLRQLVRNRSASQLDLKAFALERFRPAWMRKPADPQGIKSP